MVNTDDLEGHHLEGSPFHITVYDVTQVKIIRDTEKNTLEHRATYSFDGERVTFYVVIDHGKKYIVYVGSVALLEIRNCCDIIKLNIYLHLCCVQILNVSFTWAQLVQL